MTSDSVASEIAIVADETADATLAESARRFRSHGMVRGEEGVEGWEGPWHADMVDLGFNYRLSDLQAALGLSLLFQQRQLVGRALPEPGGSIRRSYYLSLVFRHVPSPLVPHFSGKCTGPMSCGSGSFRSAQGNAAAMRG